MPRTNVDVKGKKKEEKRKKESEGRKEKKRRKRNLSGLGHRYAGNLSYARYRTRRTHLTMARVCSRTFAAHCSPRCSPPFRPAKLPPVYPPLSTSGLAQFAVPVHASLEDTRRSSYAHIRAYTRRVLRKLAPYASIQISHLATCVPTPSELPMCS